MRFRPMYYKITISKADRVLTEFNDLFQSAGFMLGLNHELPNHNITVKETALTEQEEVTLVKGYVKKYLKDTRNYGSNKITEHLKSLGFAIGKTTVDQLRKEVFADNRLQKRRDKAKKFLFKQKDVHRLVNLLKVI